MTELNQSGEFIVPADKPKIPTGINVLTILTFIWSAYECYTNLKNFSGGKEAIAKLEEAQDKVASAPAFVRWMAGPDMLEVAKRGADNKIPMIIIGLLAVALCVYGAIEMRKLKKQGYTLWLIGEILPWVSTLIFIGPIIFNTIIGVFLIFPILFIILYTVQRKHLIY